MFTKIKDWILKEMIIHFKIKHTTEKGLEMEFELGYMYVLSILMYYSPKVLNFCFHLFLG